MLSKLYAQPCRLIFAGGCAAALGGVFLITMKYPFVWLAVAALAVSRRVRRSGSSWSHGSATTASMGQLEKHGLLGGQGLMLARSFPDSPSKLGAAIGLIAPRISSQAACLSFLAAFYGRRWRTEPMIRLRKHVHIATYAPAGAGKGVGVLVPNLLTYPGNCVVTDPKGELYELTAKRRKAFGHRIIRLDPFGVCGPNAPPSDTLNPLDTIDPAAIDFVDACGELASMMIVRRADAKDPHWDDSAERMLRAFIAYICGCEPEKRERHLHNVCGLASSKAAFARAIEVMQQMDACDGVIKRLGGQLTHHVGEELGSVLTTFARHMTVFDSPAVARNIATSSFDPMILRQGPATATVYLVLPANRLVSHAALQRMWIGTIMRAITAGKATEKNPVLWLLDEMAHIGPMAAIEDAVTLKRGMGMRLWFFFQSIEQLKTCFGDKAATVQENLGTEQFFGIRSLETAKAVSERIGDMTIQIETEGDSTSTSMPIGGSQQSSGGNRTTGTNHNRSDIARRLLKPEEILTLPKNLNLIFHENLPVILGRQVRYFDPEFVSYLTGRRKGLGVTGGILAVFTLAAGLMIAVFGAVLPQPVAGRPPMVAVPGDTPQGPAYAAPSTPPLYPPPTAHEGRHTAPAARQRRRSNDLPGKSGFLIQIR